MTVTYTAKVASCKNFGCFLKLLLRWRGSIYKLVWPDLFIFLAFYFSLSALYRFFMTPDQQVWFEKIAIYCEKYGTLIPVSFVLGFYVSIVIGRWWGQYINIPWIDTLAIWVNSNIRGDGDKERLLRRTIMRYACLTLTQCFTLISPRVKKRFPTMDHLIECGLLNEHEKEIIESIKLAVPKYPTHWIPLVWAASIVTRARQEGKITNDSVVKSIIDEINKIKDQCQLLVSYDWISVPLVYTQVVTLAVYTYFFSCIMGRQWLQQHGDEGGSGNGTSSSSSGGSGSSSRSTSGRFGVDELDLILPVFTILQFFFYMGWLKVAESLLNPFGDDDDDFELNWIVDRNLQVAYLIVDEMHQEYPELLKDQYWDEIVPQELPHTLASEQYKEEPPTSSTANVVVSKSDAELIAPPSLRSIDHALFVEETRHNDAGDGNAPNTPGFKRSTASIRSRRERYFRERSLSNQSQVTLTGSVSNRLNRIGSVFKRMISRESTSRRLSGGGGGDLGASRLNVAAADDVIEEVDENALTVVSTAGRDTLRPPTVQQIFGTDTDKDKKDSNSNNGKAPDSTAATTSAPVPIPMTSMTRKSKSPPLALQKQPTGFDLMDVDDGRLTPTTATQSAPGSSDETNPAFPVLRIDSIDESEYLLKPGDKKKDDSSTK